MLSAGQELAEVAQAELERVRSKQQHVSRVTCKKRTPRGSDAPHAVQKC